MVVDDKVETATDRVVRNLRDLKRLLVHPLTCQGSVTVHLDTQSPLSDPLIPVLPTTSAHFSRSCLSCGNRVDRLKVGRIWQHCETDTVHLKTCG